MNPDSPGEVHILETTGGVKVALKDRTDPGCVRPRPRRRTGGGGVSELCRSRLEANRLRRSRLKMLTYACASADVSMLLEICAWDEKLAASNSCRAR